MHHFIHLVSSLLTILQRLHTSGCCWWIRVDRAYILLSAADRISQTAAAMPRPHLCTLRGLGLFGSDLTATIYIEVGQSLLKGWLTVVGSAVYWLLRQQCRLKVLQFLDSIRFDIRFEVDSNQSIRYRFKKHPNKHTACNIHTRIPTHSATTLN